MCSFRVQPLWSVARRCLLLAVVWWSLAAAPAAVAQIYFGGAGPDAFGHMGNDSLFNLRDISTTGQLLSLGDDDTVNRSLGFNFSYYGTVFSSVNISSNGFLSFTNSSDGCCDSQPLPTSASWPENMIAGAWTDLDPTEGGQIRVQTLGTPGSREFVVGY